MPPKKPDPRAALAKAQKSQQRPVPKVKLPSTTKQIDKKVIEEKKLREFFEIIKTTETEEEIKRLATIFANNHEGTFQGRKRLIERIFTTLPPQNYVNFATEYTNQRSTEPDKYVLDENTREQRKVDMSKDLPSFYEDYIIRPEIAKAIQDYESAKEVIVEESALYDGEEVEEHPVTQQQQSDDELLTEGEIFEAVEPRTKPKSKPITFLKQWVGINPRTRERKEVEQQYLKNTDKFYRENEINLSFNDKECIRRIKQSPWFRN